MKFKFEDSIIRQKGMELGEDMNKLAKSFPKEELYNLSFQKRRASDSIALNISEGSILQSVPENRKFLGYSIRSTAEVVICLHKTKRRKYISEDEFQMFYKNCFDFNEYDYSI